MVIVIGCMLGREVDEKGSISVGHVRQQSACELAIKMGQRRMKGLNYCQDAHGHLSDTQQANAVGIAFSGSRGSVAALLPAAAGSVYIFVLRLWRRFHVLKLLLD